MKNEEVKCPRCGNVFPVAEALGAQIREETEAALKSAHAAELENAIEKAKSNERSDLEPQIKRLENEVAEEQKKAQEAEAAELALRKEKIKLEERERNLELEVFRKTEEEVQKRESSIRQSLTKEHELEIGRFKRKTDEIEAAAQRRETMIRQEEADKNSLKLKEKDTQIANMSNDLADAQRRLQLGSQELQGEVLEEEIREALMRQFPQDRITPVPKGMAGADIVQQVCTERGEILGTILWETKNTKKWQPAWLKKAKEDQRAAKAEIVLIVSVTLPDDIKDKSFGFIDDVWVADRHVWTSLIIVLREQLKQVALVRTASIGKDEKMELLYEYLTGNEFRQRVESIIDAFTALDGQVKKERRLMERHWSEREKQLQIVIKGTAGMYGELKGIAGKGLPAIPTLEIENGDYEYERDE